MTSIRASFAVSSIPTTLPSPLPQKPGPRRADKLTPEVMGLLAQTLHGEPELSAGELAQRVQSRFGVSVHPCTIECALSRRRRMGRPAQSEG